VKHLALLVVVCGCNQLLGVHAFEREDGGSPDVMPDSARTCDEAAQWSTPVKLTAPSLSSAFIDKVSDISSDERTLYLSVEQGGPATYDFVAVTRSDPDASDWGPRDAVFTPSPANLSAYAVAVTRDGMAALIALGNNLQYTTRTSPTGTFSSTTTTALALDGGMNESFPRYTKDGTTDVVYFTRLVSTTIDIFRATASGNTFGSPSAVTELNSTTDDWVPVFTGDGNTLYMGSSRAGLGHIYKATRAGAGLQFSAPVEVPELASPGFIEWPGAMTKDGCRMWITRTDGNFDIWYSEKPSI
jgi:hypothetical protein